ncbi:hypothetical protein V1507DRAFT_433977 [Lipomyces tetrasporus]
MTTIFQDKENNTVGHAGPQKAVPKTTFAKRAGGGRTPFAAKTKENSNMHHTGKISVADGGTKFKTPFKTPNEKRVPLGGKDTNARLNAMTMETKSQKPILRQTSGRRRIKQTIKPDSTKQITVAPVEAVAEDVPEIEYMPPRVEVPAFIPDDYEPLDLNALRDILNDGSTIADYHYPRDKNGLTRMEQKLNGIFDNPDNDHIPNEIDFLLPDQDGLRDFEKPLTFDGDAIQWEELGQKLEDNLQILSDN